MNIIVKPYGSDMCYCRPDTTWERENRDLYSPDCVNAWNWTPVVFARVSKAGKCISPKFASRYYDSLNFGALLYIGGADVASGSCVDHTSILPLPLYNPAVFETEGNRFEVTKNGEVIFSSEITGLIQAAEEAICKASERVSLRIGDLVAVELSQMETIAERHDSGIELKAEFCENCLFDLKVIF